MPQTESHTHTGGGAQQLPPLSICFCVGCAAARQRQCLPPRPSLGGLPGVLVHNSVRGCDLLVAADPQLLVLLLTHATKVAPQPLFKRPPRPPYSSLSRHSCHPAPQLHQRSSHTVVSQLFLLLWPQVPVLPFIPLLCPFPFNFCYPPLTIRRFGCDATANAATNARCPAAAPSAAPVT